MAEVPHRLAQLNSDQNDRIGDSTRPRTLVAQGYSAQESTQANYPESALYTALEIPPDPDPGRVGDAQA